MKPSRACRPQLLLAALVLAFTGQASAAETCKTATARYRMIDWPGFTARFIPVGKREGWLTDVALEVRSRQSGRDYWFLFDGGTARYINMISTTNVERPGWTPPPPDGGERPLREMHYMATDAALRFDIDMPKAAKPAPAYILLPDLAEILHYGQRGGPIDDAPTAFFKLEGC